MFRATYAILRCAKTAGKEAKKSPKRVNGGLNYISNRFTLEPFTNVSQLDIRHSALPDGSNIVPCPTAPGRRNDLVFAMETTLMSVRGHFDSEMRSRGRAGPRPDVGVDTMTSSRYRCFAASISAAR